MQLLKSIFQSQEERTRDAFLEASAADYEKFSARLENESMVAAQNRSLVDRRDSSALRLEYTAQTLSLLAEVDFSKQAHDWLLANGQSEGHILRVATELAPYEFIARHADGIIQAAKNDLAQHEKNLATFRRGNAVMVRKLLQDELNGLAKSTAKPDVIAADRVRIKAELAALG